MTATHPFMWPGATVLSARSPDAWGGLGAQMLCVRVNLAARGTRAPVKRSRPRAFLGPIDEKPDHLGDALGANVRPALRPVDPPQVAVPVKLGERVEERSSRGVGLERCR